MGIFSAITSALGFGGTTTIPIPVPVAPKPPKVNSNSELPKAPSMTSLSGGYKKKSRSKKSRSKKSRRT
jgi:hypothetical protein